MQPSEEKRTCYSCDWSIGTLDGLHCKLHQSPAKAICIRWLKASGADEPAEV